MAKMVTDSITTSKQFWSWFILRIGGGSWIILPRLFIILFGCFFQLFTILSKFLLVIQLIFPPQSSRGFPPRKLKWRLPILPISILRNSGSLTEEIKQKAFPYAAILDFMNEIHLFKQRSQLCDVTFLNPTWRPENLHKLGQTDYVLAKKRFLKIIDLATKSRISTSIPLKTKPFLFFERT